jgi:lambda family phage portal protein
MKASDILGLMFPRLTVRYLAGRRMLENFRAYDAAKSSQWRPVVSNMTSGDGVMNVTGSRLRQIARHLDENHDLAIAVIDDIVNNTVGAGVKLAPMVRTAGGKLNESLNDRISDLWEEWCQSPETTGELGFEAMERLVARSWLRDGEVFAQHVAQQASFRYQTRAPYALELIEADLVPFEYQDEASNTLHGIQCNDWNAPIAYFVFLNHPGDPLRPMADMKRVSAERMMHLKFTRRLRQRRGVPVIHGVINRLRDLQDYEESERIAAKVAADLTWFIKRTSEYTGAVDVNSANNRQLQMAAGAGFELLPGEDVGTIKSERPNSALVTFREAMLRAVAGGTGTRFSSIARNYNGTYSAQRQELVEGAIAYRAQFAYLVRRFYRPVYRRFIDSVVASGVLPMPMLKGMEMYRADFRAPALPWIDPSKEADAYRTLIESGLESRQEIMRQRGRDPGKVWEEIEEEQASGLFASTVEAAAPTTSAPADDGEDDLPEGDERTILKFGSAA